MLVHTVAQQYEVSLKEERKLARSTTVNYISHVRQFIRHLPPTSTLADVTPVLTRRFFLRYCETHSSGASRLMAASLHSFAHYVQAEGWWINDPTADLPLPRKTLPSRGMLHDEEINELFLACKRLPTERDRLQGRAVLAVLTYAGLRRQELLDLKMKDINLSDGRLDVRHGKGDRHRVIFLEPTARQAVRDWLHIRPATVRHDYVFIVNIRLRFGLTSIRKLFRSLAAILGWEGKDAPYIHCHAFRHGVATRLLRSGASLADVQLFLGHTSLLTTQIYLHSDENRLRECAARTALPSTTKTDGALITKQQRRTQPDQRQERRSRRIDMRRE